MEIALTQAEKIKISDSEEIYQIMLKILEREEGLGFRQEHFWVVGLALDHMLLFVELVALGSHNRFLVEPIEVLHTAVNKNARYLILVHNHPAGTLAPSEADEDLTNQLMHAAELVRLRVIEHLIITKEDFYSFCMTGNLAKLEKSKKYAVYFIEEAKLLEEGKKNGLEEGFKEGVEVGKEKGEQKGIAIGKDEGFKEGLEVGEKRGKEEGKMEEKIEMAKSMKKDDKPLEEIQKYTQLSLEQIDKL